MYKIIPLEQGSDKWLKYRKSKIGGSDAPIVMGVSPYCTPYHLWLQKMDAVPDQGKTWAMQRGVDLEPVARKLMEQKLGCELPATTVESVEHPWQFASLDGMSLDGKLAIEIKCPGEVDHAIAVKGMIPLKYMPQLQHQMSVSGLESMYYVSYHDNDLQLFEVSRKDGYISDMLDCEMEFLKCMQEFTPPKLTSKDCAHNHSDEWHKTSQEWCEIQSQIKRIETREKQLRQALIEMSGDSNTQGFGVKVVKVVRKGSINYNELHELHKIDPEELEAYRKPPFSYWKIVPSAREE
jgi:putative phage-type endonuclease